MALTVPKYSQQVDQRTGQSPDAPNLNTVPEAAFGQELARRTEQTGEVVSSIANRLSEHIIEKKKQNALNDVLEADNDARKELQGILTSNDSDIDGVPIGIFNRTGSNSLGSTISFDKQSEELRKKYIDQFQNQWQKDELSRSLGSHILSAREAVIRHEATQDRELKKSTLDSVLNQRVEDSALISNPEILKESIKNASKDIYSVFAPMGFANMVPEKESEVATRMVENYLTPIIERNPSEAMMRFDEIKDVLSPTDSMKMKKHIMVQAKQFEELKKHQKEIEYDDNMRDMTLSMINGKMTISEAERLYKNDQIKLSDLHTAQRIMGADDYKFMQRRMYGQNPPDHEIFNEIRENQLNQDLSPGQITRKIASALSEKRLNKEDANYLMSQTKSANQSPIDQEISSNVDTVRKFAERYFSDNPVSLIERFTGTKEVTDSQNNKVKLSAKDAQSEEMVNAFIRQVDQEKATGKRISEIRKEVQDRFIKKRHPEVGNLEELPDVIWTANNQSKKIFDPGTSKTKTKFKFIRSSDNK